MRPTYSSASERFSSGFAWKAKWSMCIGLGIDLNFPILV